MPAVELEDVPASLAAGGEDPALGVHLDDGLRIVALGAKDKSGEGLENLHFLKQFNFF